MCIATVNITPFGTLSPTSVDETHKICMACQIS